MQAGAAGLPSRMWKAISVKRTAWGWIVAILSVLLHFSDKWDSLHSSYEKLKHMGAFLKFIADAAQSPLVQLTVLMTGLLWVGLAAFFSARNARIVPSGNHDSLILEGNLEQKIKQ